MYLNVTARLTTLLLHANFYFAGKEVSYSVQEPEL